MAPIATGDFLVKYVGLAGQFEVNYDPDTIGQVLSEENWSTIMTVINSECLGAFAERFGATIQGKLATILVKKTLKKAILGPFALPFTVVELGATMKVKGEALQVALKAVDDYIEKVNAKAAEKGMQAKMYLVEARVGNKKFKAIRVRWGEGYNQMHPDDSDMTFDEEEGDIDALDADGDE